MKRAALVLGSILFLAAPLAEAASGILLPDTTPVERAMDAMAADQDREDAAAITEGSAELFPAIEQEKGVIDAMRDKRIDGFLTVRIGTQTFLFKDVPAREWFAPYVRDIAERQLVSGYRDVNGFLTGLFGPADPVTLEQMAKIAVLAAGIDATSCAETPANVSASGSWAKRYVSCAEARGWAVYSDASRDMRLPATREEVVMTLLQAFKQDFAVDPSTLPFTDVVKTTPFAPAIAKASADGVVSGYTDGQGNLTGLFGPGNNVTRAEFSKIISIALQLYGQ